MVILIINVKYYIKGKNDLCNAFLESSMKLV